MSEELFMRLKAYQETVTLARRMLEAGLISHKEFTLTKGIDWSLLSRMERFVKPHGRTAAVQKAGHRR